MRSISFFLLLYFPDRRVEWSRKLSNSFGFMAPTAQSAQRASEPPLCIESTTESNSLIRGCGARTHCRAPRLKYHLTATDTLPRDIVIEIRLPRWLGAHPALVVVVPLQPPPRPQRRPIFNVPRLKRRQRKQNFCMLSHNVRNSEPRDERS